MTVFVGARWLIPAICALVFISSCGSSSIVSRDKADPTSRVEDVASVPIDPKALQQDKVSEPIKQQQRVESVGDCAPRYKTSGQGACINNRPCRGFGVRTDSGEIICTCYGISGGCSSEYRCDDRKLMCVPEDEPLFGRTPSK